MTTADTTKGGLTRDGARQRRSSRPLSTLAPDHIERISLVCKYFCQGHKPAGIPKLLKKHHNVEISRETSYRYLVFAAEHGWMKFEAPTAQSLRDRLRTSYPWLTGIEVVHSGAFEHVAYRAADELHALIIDHARRSGEDEIHVGFSGGHSTRWVTEVLAELLCQSREGLPKTIVFHAMVAGFDVRDPTTDPNTFLTYFVNDPDLKVETRVYGLHAPPIVQTETLEDLKRLEGVAESFEAAKDLDIIVTSLGSWARPCKHSMLRKYMERSPRSLEILRDADCRGDMLWRPLGRKGPINDETPIRAMTLVELSDVPEIIRQGTSVMVVLGPCRACYEPRSDILETVLNLDEHLLTHLVVDSRSVKGMLGRAT